MKKILAVLLACLAVLGAFSGAAAETSVPVKVLILPKFEIGEMTGDYAGEAQYYYEAYCLDGEAYEVAGLSDGTAVYVKDGIALLVTGMGKVNASVSLSALLLDARFDFSGAYILSTGCAGGAAGETVPGDVVLVTACADIDLGHTIDGRELTDAAAETTWFRDGSYDGSAFALLNEELTEKAFALIKDIPVETTPDTEAMMRRSFPGEAWAERAPKVLRGTGVTGDNYWKGKTGHSNAVLAAASYGCPDPYAVTEMEDVALAVTARRFGVLDRLLILRDVVNMDVFLNGITPEGLWGGAEVSDFADAFEVARKNNFIVGDTLIQAILKGEL